ncbi:MAG: TAXI family TRAP transporter solute-binding subunit [Caulobacterales bacterium]|uniref:TAXI family TRAP transporter solute-binding subunit n=1 Tax=Glycocaulis sp. TaxID=1969725 RepID=UPI003FA17F0D
MRKYLIAAVVALPLSFGFGSGTMAQEVIFSAVGPTTQDYQMAVAWSNLLAEAGSDLKMTVVDNGSVKGLRQVAQGQADIVAIGAPHYKDATEKDGQFQQDPDDLIARYRNMRALFAITTSAAQYVVRADSGIMTIPEFKGKTLAIGRPGGNAGRVTAALFKTHGVDLEAGDADGQYLKYQPALEQMANGTMDGTLVWGGIPHAAIDNASRQMKLRFVSPDPSKLDDFRKTISNGEYYVFQEVPAETLEQAYEGRVEVAGPAHFWTFPFMMVVRDDMPEETAYALVKTFWDNIAQVNGMSPALSLIQMKNAATALSADLHPGAARYYREAGLI